MNNNLYIVGIGASAGGLEAIHEFFDQIPQLPRIAFVIVQHLSSDYKSLLVELVSKHTQMKVVEATDKQRVEPACVYVIPNNKFITVKNGHLQLDRKDDKAPSTAIDNFFVSLAREKKEQAIAVVLSGTGNDGTKGIELIKHHGGMVMVQQPDTAKFDGMPLNAVASGQADHVLPVSKMYDKLLEYINDEPIRSLENGDFDEEAMNEVFRLVLEHTQQDFTLYKTPTILRRLGRRMLAANVWPVSAYIKKLQTDEEEVKALAKDFLIGVTRFFRDEQAFEVLKAEVIPNIVAEKEPDDLLKVWVCACSTGEEVYSLAILIDQHLKANNNALEVKIFASDIDATSLEIASRNSYPESSVKHLPSSVISQYFVKEDTRYAVIPYIRKQVVFARHDVTKSPPFIKVDLVSCRNMLIYMNSVLQQKVLSTFHFALNTGGYLFLGPSETITPIKEGVTEVNSKWKIYKKTGQVSQASSFSYEKKSPVNRQSTFLSKQPPKKTPVEQLQNFLIEQYGFVAVFIDRAFDVKNTIGDYKRFLSLPELRLEINLLKMVPKEISFLLNNAIRLVWKEQKPRSLKKVRVKRDQEDVYLNIDVSPADPDSENPYTMVIFSQVQAEVSAENIVLDHSENEQQTGYVLELESELADTRNNLQMAVEEMETANEELQSSNEELLSANEELQSSNEELQSLNEELHTLNTEHQQKIKELIDLNDDLNNYFKSVDIGQIYVDTNSRIRKFNPAAVDMVNLIEADIGRPLSHISNNIKYDNFLDDIKATLQKEKSIEREIELRNGQICLMRIQPYLRRDGQADGAVITFVDVSALNELNSILSGVFKISLSAVLVFKAERNEAGQIKDFVCLTANVMAAKVFGKPGISLTGLSLKKQLTELLQGELFEQFKELVESGISLQTELYFEGKGWFIVMASKINDGFAVTYTDVTDRKNGEQNLKRNYNELISTRESLKKLNNELEDRIRERTLSLSMSEERFNLVSKATNDTVWDWDLVKNEVWRSNTFTPMFGYELTESCGNVDFWFERIHPDDRERIKEEVYSAINEGETSWSSEYRFLRADNVYIDILDRGSIQHDRHGIPYRMVGSVIDITRIKEAEQKRLELQEFVSKQQEEFYRIFVNAPALISIRRGEGLTYEFINNAFQDFYPGIEFLNLSTEEAHQKLPDTQLYQGDQEILATGEALSGQAFHVKHFDGEGNHIADAWLDYLFTPVFNSQNEVDGIAFFGFEVTNLVRAQQATRDLMLRKDEFMSIASHELKTPITSLKGALQIGQRMANLGKPSTVLKEYLDKAMRQTDKVTVLVNDLLDMTKIHSGKMELNVARFDIVQMVKETVNEFCSNSSSHTVYFDESAGPVYVQADRPRLEQVVTNFLGNAVKYSPEADKIVVEVKNNSNETVTVSVQDYGIGIPRNKQERVFDRYFRVHESSFKFAGLGLGLFICKDIIERHGGQIGLVSADKEGSTFWFSLPVEK
ncbi:chemotaxis protein CheB [Desertivirga arenae]|uniref:chemotaxis protein CheB n=1 Tax=Desertivirga arenae TaxID=2810309 RepID=UPI001A959C6F|nr:chemotaxis protein CheB [Pedobacter sp. SYSU D00823]